MEIRYLAEMPEALPKLIEMFLEEWPPYYGSQGLGDAKEDLRICCQIETLPIALVALAEDGKIAGTGALRGESRFAKRAEGPWIAALVVERSQRGQGVGSALIAALESEARRLGFTSLYSATDTVDNILLRRGWRAVNQGESLLGTVTIYHAIL